MTLLASEWTKAPDQERQLFRAEPDLASSTRDQLTAVVQVYKALGGGWER
jgi:outer membrane protein TolC